MPQKPDAAPIGLALMVLKALRRFSVRLTNSPGGNRMRERLREEMEEHLAQQTAENVRAGMTAAEAHRQAAIKFGPTEAIREAYHNEVRLPFIETLLQDLRYAVRQLVASPGFASVAILTIALGIGATTAIYSVVDAVLLHPLPYPQPEQLVRVQDDLPGIGAQSVGVSIPEWRDMQSTGIFEFLSIAGRGASVNLTGSAQPLRLSFKQVTPNYFALLGVDAQLGRTFDPNDATPGYNLEVVMSDGLWRKEFGADTHIIGKALRLDNDVYHVVGVMPRRFRDQGSTSEEQNVELWLGAGFAGLPFAPPQRDSRLHSRAVIARLKPGLSVAAAQGRLNALVASLQKQFPADYPPESAWSVHLIPLSETVVGNVRQPLLLMMGAVGMVLLIGCVNVANLLLARATARGREMAVRQALGAARSRLIRQLLTESLLLSLLGGIASLAILFLTRKLLLQMIPASLPRLNDISINWTVLLFALGVSVLAGAFFGLAPALQATRLDPIRVLRQEGRGSKGSRGQTWTLSALVITEFALSLVLLIAAGLLLRSFWDLFKVQPGFNPDRVMAVQTWLPGPNDPTMDRYQTATQESVLLREILRRSRSLPGVEEVSIGDVAALPLGHSHGALEPLRLIREGHETIANLAPEIGGSVVSPEYFHLLGMPLERGRLFSDQDVEGTPLVAVINQAAARTWWPGQDPVGKRVRLRGLPSGRLASDGSASQPWTTIVGVVADARTESLADAVAPEIYRSVYQRPFKDLSIFLRGQLDPASLPDQARNMVQSIDAELPVFGAKRLPDVVSSSLAQRRFSMEMILFFALTALLLAGIGVYGTISYIVSERSRDIGIRIALGAQRKTILHMVLSQGLSLALAGAAIGLVGAWIVAHLMAGLLYGISPADPLTFISLTAVLMLVALAACYIPARRAMRVDPVVALREA